MQVKFIISAIDAASRSFPLHGLPQRNPQVYDSSDGVVEVQLFLSHTDPVHWHGVESLHARALGDGLG